MNILKVTIIAALCILLMVLFISCSKAPKAGDENTEVNINQTPAPDTTAVKTPAQMEWEQFKADEEAMIAANDKIIMEYKTKMTDTKGKLKASYNKKIEALEMKNKEMKTKLDGYKQGNPSEWDKFKAEFKINMDLLDKDIQTVLNPKKK
jgi:uncharacterized protein HemX